MKPIFFLSDYGYEDEFAGVCRAVIAREAPGAQVIDITHGIAPHDVRAGALALRRSVVYSPPAVHLAVVDPGVGTERQPVAVRVAEGGHLLVGPDNGLLAPAIRACGGAAEAVDLSESPVLPGRVFATFHGRDIFAPVAAHLATGSELEHVGFHISPESLVMPPAFEPELHADHIVAHVVGIDRYGNCSLDLDRAGLDEHPIGSEDELIVDAGGRRALASRGLAFADAPPGGLVVYEDAAAAMALAINRGSAARELGLVAGGSVVLRSAGV